VCYDWHGVKEEQARFLSLLGQLAARLTAEQAGWVLNCQPHDIPAPEQGVFRFHNWLSLFRDTSPVSTTIVNARCGEVSASSSQFWRIVLPFTP
jgi:hypothetical protein